MEKISMKHFLGLSLLAMLAGGAVSCTQEASIEPGTQTPPESAVYANGYMAFRLEDPEQNTRDTHKEYDDDYERYEWFNKGTAGERAITTDEGANRVFFFNADYSFYGASNLVKPDDITVPDNVYVARKPGITDDDEPTKADGDDSASTDNSTGSTADYPAYAMVIINAKPSRLDKLDSLLTTAPNAVEEMLTYRNLVQVDNEDPESIAMYNGKNGKFFTMSSTVWRNGNEKTDKIVALNELNPAGPVFYETVEEALLPENITEFFVERILAKYTLIVKNGVKNITFDETGAIILNGPNKLKVRMEYAPVGENNKDVKTGWKINLVNWGLNGLEKNTYMVKKLAQDYSGDYPWVIADNFYTGWNSPNLGRSFWAIDENYSTGIYPDQYRQALDVEGVNSATRNNIYSKDYSKEEGLVKDEYTLVYKSYNAFTDRAAHKYSVENTFDTIIFKGKDLSTEPWLRCGTHIILTAQFIMDEIDGDVKNKTVDADGFMEGIKDKYFSNGLYWSEKALKEQAVATLMTNIYYNKKNDGIPNVLGTGYVKYINTEERPLDRDAPVAIDGTVLKHEDLSVNAEKYFEFAPAFIKGGDGWVSLKLKDEYKGKVKANYADGTEGDISDEQLVSYIYRFTNLAKHYKKGRMYYALRLRHNLESPYFNVEDKVAPGDYGTVRNTWYRLTLETIERPGTPVDDPEQPIIPNPEPDEKSLGVEVKIIDWRTVEIDVDQLH